LIRASILVLATLGLSAGTFGAVPLHGLQARPDRTAERSASWVFATGLQGLRVHDRSRAELRVEYRPPGVGPQEVLVPVLGLTATWAGSILAYGGVALDLPLGARWRAGPSFAAGVYGKGTGRDLNHPFQFRTGVALAYRLGARGRLGLSATHLSNGGLSDPNPGVESLTLFYALHR